MSTIEQESLSITRALARRDRKIAEHVWLTAALYLERAGHDEAADALRDEVPRTVVLRYAGTDLTMRARR